MARKLVKRSSIDLPSKGTVVQHALKDISFWEAYKHALYNSNQKVYAKISTSLPLYTTPPPPPLTDPSV